MWFTAPGRGPRHGTIERAYRNGTYGVLATADEAYVSAVPEAWIRPDLQEALPLAV